MSSASTSPARTDAPRRGEPRRRELLEATLRVVARGGVGTVTHRVVAAEAGVPLGSTTYYFKTKEDMVAQALELVTERELAATAALRAERLDAATSPDALARVIADFMTRGLIADGSQWLAEYELFLEAIRRPELQGVAARWTAAQMDVLLPALERLGVRDPGMATRLLVAGLDGLALEFLAHGESVDRLEPLVRDLVRRIANG